MQTITGVVEKINQRDYNYGLKLMKDERWFGGKGQCPFKEGTEISIDVGQNGKFWNILPDAKDYKERQKMPNENNKDKSENRRRALGCAVATVSDTMKGYPQQVLDKEVLRRSKVFEDYLNNGG